MKGVTSPTFCCTLFVPIVTLYRTGHLKIDFFFRGKIKKPLEIKRLSFCLDKENILVNGLLQNPPVISQRKLNLVPNLFIQISFHQDRKWSDIFVN